MQVVIMRHGATPSNERHRYVGSTDEPLSELGEQQALEAGVCPQVTKVYVSPLKRARRTAELCFPNAEQVVVDGLQEMDFGVFEGRSASEMEDDAEYRSWVDGMCAGRCPGGEMRDEFTERVAAAVKRVVREAQAHGEERVIIAAHGGTVMAALYALSNDEREYFDWHVGNCQGYCVDVEGEGDAVRLVNPQRFADLSFLNDAIALPPESFFQNRSCKYFPCHEGVDEVDFNCLFCYCPLYALGPGCGGNYTYTKKGYKNCVNCAVPHVRDNGVRLAKEHFKQLAELAKQE